MSFNNFLPHLGLDIMAITLLTIALYLPRHRRRDLVFVYSAFNLGLFSTLVIVSSWPISTGLGFGVFAMLSFIRLRSEAFSNLEIGYFFMALVLALINGLAGGSVRNALIFDGVLLLLVFVADHPRLQRHDTRRQKITLGEVIPDNENLLTTISAKIKAEVIEAKILETDYVAEKTIISVRYRPI